MNNNWATRLENCYTGAVFDVLKGMGYSDQLLPHHIRPINIHHKIAGLVFTVNGKTDHTISKHDSLLRWCEMLSKAPAGHILTIQPNDNELAFMGELSAETLTYKKLKGSIVDGGCRDSAFIDRIGFPVFCTYFTPRDVVASWYPETMGEPIVIGDVVIATGDFALADRDGIIIIPQQMIAEVVEQAETVLKTENLVRKAILSGVDPVEAYLQFKKF